MYIYFTRLCVCNFNLSNSNFAEYNSYISREHSLFCTIYFNFATNQILLSILQFDSFFSLTIFGKLILNNYYAFHYKVLLYLICLLECFFEINAKCCLILTYLFNVTSVFVINLILVQYLIVPTAKCFFIPVGAYHYLHSFTTKLISLWLSYIGDLKKINLFLINNFKVVWKWFFFRINFF